MGTLPAARGIRYTILAWRTLVAAAKLHPVENRAKWQHDAQRDVSSPASASTGGVSKMDALGIEPEGANDAATCISSRRVPRFLA